MCGICGILYFDDRQKVSQSVLRSMCDTIIHRGPDDQGQVMLGQVGLGMRRLSIIDLSTGHQPIANEENTLWIVFNGEIYNFKRLRKELENLGHQFKTRSDTEIILHGYEEWGEDVCQRLNGMFVFAVWDQKNKILFLGRDRLGIKPLYYYQDDQKLVFGSELKAILKCPGLDCTLDPVALNNYLTFEYIPAPRSIFREIRKLRPGHWLRWQADQLMDQFYWKLAPCENSISEAEAGEKLSVLLNDAVRLRLISDVPLGAFLSGGLDSSIMVAQMAELMDQPVKTFSIGFKESSYNELNYARAVAKKYQTEHHEFVIEANALELTEKLICHLDEPFGDFSIFPTYLVSKMARDYVTVVLSGDGGDELFAGYDTYRAHRFDRQFYHRLPKILKYGILEPMAGRMKPTEKKKGWINSYKRFIQGTRLPKSLYHVRWMVFLQAMERKEIFTDDVLDELAPVDPYDFIHEYSRQADGLHDVTRTGYIDVKSYLADDILVKVDRMSMAVSLEARVPYLDHRIVEFCYSLPPVLKMKGYRTKYLLEKTFWNLLPSEVQRRDKQGFSIPIKNWIRGELRPMMLDLLSEDRIRQQGLFRPETVHRWINEHLEGIENHSHTLWALMVFQQWNEIYSKTIS
ncbi:asparagine synthase (glutamine-hydrolyzing) [bacterium]|nr:asparagine synthase (glutamine-hydrolyzing) [bacterium]